VRRPRKKHPDARSGREMGMPVFVMSEARVGRAGATFKEREANPPFPTRAVARFAPSKRVLPGLPGGSLSENAG
jgi:hypothetical protein